MTSHLLFRAFESITAMYSLHGQQYFKGQTSTSSQIRLRGTHVRKKWTFQHTFMYTSCYFSSFGVSIEPIAIIHSKRKTKATKIAALKQVLLTVKEVETTKCNYTVNRKHSRVHLISATKQ